MLEYAFRYDDGTGMTVTKYHRLSSDRDALDAASYTFERFSVQVWRDQTIIGAFAADGAAPPDMTDVIA